MKSSQCPAGVLSCTTSPVRQTTHFLTGVSVLLTLLLLPPLIDSPRLVGALSHTTTIHHFPAPLLTDPIAERD
jgi:hypothetical protein